MKEERYMNVILEKIRNQMQAVLEIAADINKKVEPIPRMQTDIADLKSDMRVVKKAITDTNADLKLLDRRVTTLETSRS